MVWHNEKLPYTLENAIKADIAGQVLNMVYLKKIREDASAAYSCGARGSASIQNAYHNIVILAYCPMKPEKKQLALDIMRAEVPALAQSCDASMLTKVKEYLLKQNDDQTKTNGYWMGVIDMYRKYGIDMHTDFKRLVTAQTPQSISAFVKEFLNVNNRVTVTMLPDESKK